ncbi:AAA family ATPase [Gordonia sp. NB41Y]|uniref:AAA family ATPase n=1 Tax=Gordonia sp. NB41Y TaxID=875808 RepID=UPI0006B1F3E4|nr:AAA family ATPase [Gordonia sp. NB41Y]EMP14528.2 hypothetical protein ISGA_77 [Gordonia sp. NB41Y]WLP91765.1 AAA family ATPase [Gordonia sp. NB41Y]
MTEVPIRAITISDFRRLAGTRTLPLDAPIVLVHGSNGAGKTSLLSALELGLTGQIRSLRRLDPRYTAYLPTLGQDFATVRVEVDPTHKGKDGPSKPLTAGGSRIEGFPALTAEGANFYGERCFLDQASLGRLLDLYQHREGKQESALAQFVNELLGLEQLDALRTGLSDANNLRLLKNLADRIKDATIQADLAATDLIATTRNLTEARAEVDRARERAYAAARSIGFDLLETSTNETVAVGENADERLIVTIRTSVADQDLDVERRRLLALQRDLIALGGRLDATDERPSTQDLTEALDQLDQAVRRFQRWNSEHSSEVAAWQRAAHEAGVEPGAGVDTDIERVLSGVQRLLTSQAELQIEHQAIQSRHEANQQRVESLQERLLEAQAHATSLVEGLASIRPAILGDICPVCDRDYAELGLGDLDKHVDVKITQLSQQGRRLLNMRRERDDLLATTARTQSELTATAASLLDPVQMRDLEEKERELTTLRERWLLLRPAAETGRGLRAAEMQARRRVEELEAASSEYQIVRTELARCASVLSRPIPDGDTPRAVWESLSSIAGSRLDEIGNRATVQASGIAAADQLEQALRRHADAIERVATAAQHKDEWDVCVKEGRRRQAVARTVFDAATEVRTNVVQRVFTESLNRVWMSLFTRLAPNEGFIPSFGVPTSSKAGLELAIHTVHRDGGEGGSPQMMLSAGNLNTAALSLFLALHLAVNPVLPCLVFDDPVQAMDEVHVAQFAALIRTLARQHERQVIIAVHERELFDYLALELSPAYEGDELLTIELGERSFDRDQGIRRHVWERDSAITG